VSDPNNAHTVQPERDSSQLSHLTNRLIPTPSRPRARPTNPKAKQQLLPQPLSLPPRQSPTAALLRLLPLAPPPRLAQPLRRDLIQPLVLDPELAPARPKITTVPDHANVERVRRVARPRESVRRLARREPVKAEEVHEEARAAARLVVVLLVSVRVASGRWRRVSRERVVGVCRLEWVRVAVAHLRCEGGSAPTHEAVPAEVGHLERRHLTCDLEEL